jgi:hypothetical protein
MTDQYVEKHWREVNARNSCKQGEFAKGIKDFKFSVGQGYGFIPSQSYFRVELKLKKGNANPTLADGCTFSDNPCGNLFNNVYFNMGGQTVSFISNGVAQCDILKSRLTKNPSYNKSIGNALGLNGHYYDRLNQLFSISQAVTVNIADPNQADVLRDGVAIDQESRSKYVSEQGRFQRNFIWQPSLGIFDYSLPMGAGEYEFQLNPAGDFATACVDSGTALNENNAANITVEVQDVRFYACMCRVNLDSSGKEEIHLMEMEVMNANIAIAANTNINQEFTVPSSTRAVTMFIQDQNAGKETSCPASRFTNKAPYQLDALNLRDYQIEYANMTKPVIRVDSQYVAGSNPMYQRYISTALESGQFFQLTGCETFEEWVERGPIFHETFIKSADNLSTRLHVVATYGAINATCRLFMVAHYSRTIKIIRQNGLVVSVTSSSV